MDQFYLEQKDPEFKNPTLCGALNFQNSWNLSYLNVLFYPNLADPVQREGTVDKTSLSDWLSQSAVQPCASATSPPILGTTGMPIPVGGLRLLFGQCSFDDEKGLVLPLDENSFHLVESRFGLPKEFQEVMKVYVSRSFKHTSRDHDGNARTCFVFKFGMFQPSYYQLALSYNTKTRITYGLFLSKTSEHKIPNLIDTLKEEPWRCEQPLYLAALLAELSVNTSAERIQCAELRLNDLEEMMGQHEYANMRKGRPLEIDFESATTSLNFHTKWLAVQSMRLNSVLLALDQIVFETREIAKRCGGNVGELDLASLTSEFDSLRMMEEFVAYLANTARNLLLRAEYENKRIGAQIQVVYQFMAHKNANVNIELAKHTSILAEASKDDSAAMRTIALESSFLARASKEDSSSMKTISIVGMVFLPGTFLATIFAMPVFNWDGSNKPILKPGFGYYMAVTLPLTCIVLLIWGLAMKIRSGEKVQSEKGSCKGLFLHR